ncbi:hypothetical protein NW766_001842 [Fusarium irregulare]|uniref:Uncharacterized protein n=1 Tax=Fusarium irregulare TaxID=2494466 RepID=A0A9W8Q1V0_9HYPO|nr:hypothetical protein NW766_001842 [Fusarium irregulare]
MALSHGFPSSVGVKHRFNTPDEDFVEEQELLLRPEEAGFGEEREVEEYSPLRKHFTLLGLGYLSFYR